MSSTRQGKGKSEDVSDIQIMVKTLVNKICTSDDFLNSIASTITSTINDEFGQKIKKLEVENRELKEQILSQDKLLKNLSNKYDRLDQQLRNKTIRIYGIKEHKKENLCQVVTDFVKSNMEVELNGKIENCYRAGKIIDRKMRPIVVHFRNLEDKKIVYGKKKNLKGKGIVIREDLAQEKIKILKLTIEKINKNGKVWTSDGRIFATLSGDNEIYKINSIEDINMLKI